MPIFAPVFSFLLRDMMIVSGIGKINIHPSTHHTIFLFFLGYLDWMADLLPGSFHEGHPIREFTVSYLSEAREGEEITLNYELSPEGALRLEATEAASGHRVFAVSALYEG